MGRWHSPNPAGAAELFRGATTPWWIAGGWAIELFVGSEVREHSDLEVGCFRPDVPMLAAQLSGWELFAAIDGSLEPFDASSIADSNVHSIWCRPAGSEYWVLEILIEERDGTDWTYRRDNRIRFPVANLARQSGTGLPYLCPEVQLLYKSKEPRAKDDVDFAVAWPLLDTSAQNWLATTVRSVSPRCKWNLSS